MSDLIAPARARLASLQEARRVTAQQVRTLVQALGYCQPLDRCVAATGLTPDEVFDLVSEFGTWLTHVYGSADVEVVRHSNQLQLFYPGEKVTNTGRIKAPKRSREERRRRAARAVRYVANPHRVPSGLGRVPVVVPVGFEVSSRQPRDVAKALAQIVVRDPDESICARFVSRRYAATAPVVTFPLIAAVWRFATLGRLGEIHEVNPDDREFLATAIAAYDLLEVARASAMEALHYLLSGPEDLDAIAAACAKLHFVAAGEMQRLERIVELARTSAESRRLLAQELGFLAQRVRSAPRNYVLRTIADLNDGQVMRIAQAAGVETNQPTRATEAEIRRRLDELGLAADADRLVPLGTHAIAAGLEVEFWDAVGLRADGDPDWDAAMRALFAQRR